MGCLAFLVRFNPHLPFQTTIERSSFVAPWVVYSLASTDSSNGIDWESSNLIGRGMCRVANEFTLPRSLGMMTTAWMCLHGEGQSLPVHSSQLISQFLGLT